MIARLSMLTFLLLVGCTHYVDKSTLISRMNSRTISPNSHINILWYKGTQDELHYLRHIYAMFGATDYSISDRQLIVEAPIPYSNNSDNWVRIRRIGNAWRASRRDINGRWKEEPEGIVIDNGAGRHLEGND